MPLINSKISLDAKTVYTTFDTEKEAALFNEHAATAWAMWKWSTGRLSKPHCDLSNRDEEKSASPKTTEHSSLESTKNE